MEKYKATPGALVVGSAMRNFFVSLNRDEFMSIVETKLAEAGIDELHDDEWYPHQITLDIFKAISESTNVTQNLVALGVAYVETATFPPEANTIEAALMLLDVVYQLNIQHIAEGEGYAVEKIADKHIRVIDHNPFPHDTVYGFIWGISKRFRPEGSYPRVVRTYENETDPDSAGAMYDVNWD